MAELLRLGWTEPVLFCETRWSSQRGYALFCFQKYQIYEENHATKRNVRMGIVLCRRMSVNFCSTIRLINRWANCTVFYIQLWTLLIPYKKMDVPLPKLSSCGWHWSRQLQMNWQNLQQNGPLSQTFSTAKKKIFFFFKL